MIENERQVSQMFGFENNKLHIKCNFESVRRIYEKQLLTINNQYRIDKTSTPNKNSYHMSNYNLSDKS